MSPTAPTTPSSHPNHRARRLTLLAAAAVFAFALGIFSQLGNAAPGLLTAAVLVERLIFAGGAAGAYILAAVGLGRVVRPWLAGMSGALALQSATGLALMLWTSHLLAWLGLLGGPSGPYVALAVVLAGLGIAGHQFLGWMRAGGFEPRLAPLGILGAAGVAVLAVAACNPPGWLWDSEFGGYDALSYHLALPQEWLADGRLAPLKHNVYSFLPSYVEAAFLHLGVMNFAPGPSDRAWGLVAGEGHAAFACQFLNLLMTVMTAWWCGRAAAGAAERCRLGADAAARAGVVAGTLILVTPWAVVTGSLAYNDMGVVGMLAAAIIVVFEPSLAPWRRGVLLGVLVGAACSIKPTALLFAACPVGLGLLLTLPRREWARVAACGALAGMVMVLPWLIRNWLASGNPVFPFAAALFPNDVGGTGHWTPEQVSRFGAAHRFEGSMSRRLSLAILPDELREGVTETSRWRGMSHPQWGLFFPMLAAAALACLPNARTRRIAGLLAGMVVLQVGLWLFGTHVQSRFLLPVLATGSVLGGLAAASIRIRSVAPALAWVVCLVQLALAIDAFSGQRARRPGQTGQPNALLVGGVFARTGEFRREEFAAANPRDRAALLGESSPEWYVNWAYPKSRVYLLGGATPLYLTPRVLYNSTWDSWPLGEAAAAHPGDGAAWSAQLRAQGVDLVLIDLGEIKRLARSGWIDPLVNLDEVTAWMGRHTTLIREWREPGIYLVSIKPPDPGARP
ncbi:hypothetical protein PHYC_02369 [Phycisphaerales bacterium]|nr:hypothetical protein PHYC_02369 [Phycisphaerales bacterium]